MKSAQPSSNASPSDSSSSETSTKPASAERRSGSQNYRTRHRSQQHDSAHDDPDTPSNSPPETVAVHPLVPRGHAKLILTNDDLLEFVAHLRAAGTFAYDSEFIGELSYVPKLCLVQVATATQIALIDPLMPDLDLLPFWELLADPTLTKITHAGEQDVEPVLRFLGRRPQNLFDTQICAGFVGMAYPVSLSKLVLELLGAKLAKGLTFTHWDQRPLSNQQLRYAADDVRYLIAMHDILAKRLEANGNAAFARAECDALCQTKVYQFDPATQYLKVRRAGGLLPQGLEILRELTNWRDAAARDADSPPRAFLKDEILIDLSRNPAKSIDKLSRVRGLPRPVEIDHGQAIVSATLQALSVPVTDLPSQRFHEPTPTQRFRADALWAVVQCVAAGKQIDPSLVASRQEIIDLLRTLDQKATPSEASLFTGWRNDAVGSTVMNLLEGKKTLEVSVDQGILKAQ